MYNADVVRFDLGFGDLRELLSGYVKFGTKRSWVQIPPPRLYEKPRKCEASWAFSCFWGRSGRREMGEKLGETDKGKAREAP